MADFTISPATRSALFALSSLQNQIGLLQGRLATGKRVNVPTDDPAAFFTAAGLSSRASAINALMTGITSTQGAISAANDGITAIESLLISAQGIANLALQSPQVLTTVTGTNSSAFTTASTIATAGGSATSLKADDTVTVSDGTTTATYTAGAGDTIQTFLNAVNNTANLNVTATLNTSGQLQFTATSNVNITIGGTLAGAGGGTLTSTLGLTAGTSNYTANTTRSQLASQFNNLLGQIDQAAADAGFDGVNLLTGGSSTVSLNEDGTASLTVIGSMANSSALGATTAGNNFQLNTDINTALTNIGTALSSIQAISSTIGSTETVLQIRADFNKAMMNTLNSGADALTASDANADSAALLALQTRQQIALTSLSLTRGEDASTLRLFGL
jgi:flagellin